MEYFIFLFILIIVIATGYVLSKPFTRQSEEAYEEQLVNFQRQYQDLLVEIKSIEKDCQVGSISIDDSIHQINKKKKKAANLLRLIDPTMKIESVFSDEIQPTETDKKRKTAELLSIDSYYCPQCAGKVITSDKFCMHCGHRLQP